MRIYNYLFYKSYLLAQRSRNFDDTPVLGGIIFVVGCLMFNIFTIVGLLEGFDIRTGIEFKKEYRFVFSISLVLLILWFYMHNGRYKKIISYYEQKYNGKSQLHPIIIVILYYGFSVFLMFMSAMFKNQDWIFAK